jgi:hypothetical protein
MVRGLYWARYPAITLRGFRFMKRGFHAAHVPPHVARLYLLLLRLIRSKGVLAIGFVRRKRHGSKVIDPALSSSHVTNVPKLRMLSDRVRERIVEVKGEAPRDVYA